MGTRRRLGSRLAIWVTLIVSSAVSAHARDLPIHSDLPLFTDPDSLWPRHFTDADSFGCVHRVRTGDWRIVTPGEEESAQWLRLGNYGAMHCALVETRAYAREQLTGGGWRYSYMVQLGKTLSPKGEVELWALQSGTRPGSDYLLLSRADSDKAAGGIARFDVLQQECPKENVRDGASIDVFLTDYCAVNSRADLLRLARRMALRAPAAALEFVGEAPDEK
jgi:hypothetical protein